MNFNFAKLWSVDDTGGGPDDVGVGPRDEDVEKNEKISSGRRKV